MQVDEQQIRELVSNWHRFSAAGELTKILGLMAEDVVFLVPGRPPMRGRDEFAASFRTVMQQFRMESTGDIEELRVAGDWAYCWTNLSIIMTPLAGGGAPVRRSGNTLTIFRRNTDGSWVLFRDANLLAVEKSSE